MDEKTLLKRLRRFRRLLTIALIVSFLVSLSVFTGHFWVNTFLFLSLGDSSFGGYAGLLLELTFGPVALFAFGALYFFTRPYDQEFWLARLRQAREAAGQADSQPEAER